jgi:hypothetical protein
VPFVVEVEKPSTSVAKKGWFWGTVVGIVAAGAIAGGVSWYVLNPPPPQVGFTGPGLTLGGPHVPGLSAMGVSSPLAPY